MRNWSLILLSVLVGASLACGYAPPPKPAANQSTGSAKIFNPLPNQTFNLGMPVEVQSTSVDSQGVQRVELWVNQAVVRSDANLQPLPNSPFVVSQAWQPTTPGRYALEVKAYAVSGAMWGSEVVMVELKPAVVNPPTTPLATLIPAPSATSLSAAKDVLPTPTATQATPIGGASATPSQTQVVSTVLVITPTVMPVTVTLTATPVPTPPNGTPIADIVIDNSSPEFQTVGTWYIGDGGQSLGGNCSWAPRGSGNNAYWSPRFTVPGMYEVYAWWCGDPNHDQSNEAQFLIRSALGDQKVIVNYDELAGQWNSLGQYYFQPGESNFVNVNGGFQGNVVADGVKFVYRGAEARPAVVPTLTTTAITTTQNAPSPLEQLVSGDLAVRMWVTGNRFYRYTPLINSQEIGFDDCRDFPRPNCQGQGRGWQVQVQHVAASHQLIVTYLVSQDYKRMALVNPPNVLRERQRIFLSVGDNRNTFIQIDRQPENRWLIFVEKDGLRFDKPLPPEVVSILTSLIERYNSIYIPTTSWGGWLKFYGWGPEVALSAEDATRLQAVGEKLLMLQP